MSSILNIRLKLNRGFAWYHFFMCSFITLGSPFYPQGIRLQKNPPFKLYYIGDLNTAIGNKIISIVGSRKMTKYANMVLERFIPVFVRSGLVVVSGFMHGVDIKAHELVVSSGGRTIAILPCGLDINYPSDFAYLRDAIVKGGGLLLSRFSEGERPQRWMYIKRNELVASISECVLVIEADAGSGTMTTANIALKIKKPVFVIPSSINSPNSSGVVELLQKGAHAVNDPLDILKFFKVAYENTKNVPVEIEGDQLDVFLYLQTKPSNAYALSKGLRLELSSVYIVLHELLARGLVYLDKGKYHAK